MIDNCKITVHMQCIVSHWISLNVDVKKKKIQLVLPLTFPFLTDTNYIKRAC